MTEHEAIAAIAAVDRFRQEAVRVLPSLEALEEVLASAGQHDARALLRGIGIDVAVRRWAERQRTILANGDPDQQAVLAMLLAPDDDQRSDDDRPTASELEALILRWCAS